MNTGLTETRVIISASEIARMYFLFISSTTIDYFQLTSFKIWKVTCDQQPPFCHLFDRHTIHINQVRPPIVIIGARSLISTDLMVYLAWD